MSSNRLLLSSSITRRCPLRLKPLNHCHSRTIQTRTYTYTYTYNPPSLTNIEHIETYRPGGFHPIHLHDTLANNRYHILHKLGHGGFSTVWLARDAAENKLVSLKILTAESSASCADVEITQVLGKSLSTKSLDHPGARHILFALDHFTVKGPNGSHLCLVSQVAGPSIADLSYCPGQVAGCRRLRGDVARLFARQTAQAVGVLHGVGVVHGDIKPSNVLVKLTDIDTWSDEQVYSILGNPVTDDVVLEPQQTSNSPPSAPRYLVQPTNLNHPSLPLSKDILLTDFGHAHYTTPQPSQPQETETETETKTETALSLPYSPPDLLLPTNQHQHQHQHQQRTTASETWSLACTLFEIRAGAQLFAAFFNTPDEILRQIVQTLGKFPDPWWAAWEGRSRYFDEEGRPHPHHKWVDGITLAVEYPLLAQVRDIGAEDGDVIDSDNDNNSDNTSGEVSESSSMIERPGTRLSEEEVGDLHDLLGRMLRYHPESRIAVDEVLQHRWFRGIY